MVLKTKVEDSIQRATLGQKMDLEKFAPGKYVTLKNLRGKAGEKMLNATFFKLFTAPVFQYANVIK